MCTSSVAKHVTIPPSRTLGNINCRKYRLKYRHALFQVSCLQTNLERLEPDCRAAVANLTEEQAEHLELNYPLFKICHGVRRHCCNDWSCAGVFFL